MFTENARQGKNHFGRYLLSIIIVSLFFTAGVIPSLWGFDEQMQQYGLAVENLNFSARGIDPVTELAFLLTPFVTSLAGLIFAIKVIHKRPFISAITGNKKFRWQKVFYGGGLWFAVFVISIGLGYLINPENYTWNFNSELFFPLIIVSILLIPLQSAFEEILMRGYFMQGLILLVRYKWISILITSLVFGLLHYGNPEVQKFGAAYLMPSYIGMGLMLAIFSIMDDGLELSIGIHSVNNICSSLFITHADSAFITPALITESNITHDEILFGVIEFYLFAVVVYFILSKKYKWENIKKLLGKIKPSTDSSMSPDQGDIVADNNLS